MNVDDEWLVVDGVDVRMVLSDGWEGRWTTKDERDEMFAYFA